MLHSCKYHTEVDTVKPIWCGAKGLDDRKMKQKKQKIEHRKPSKKTPAVGGAAEVPRGRLSGASATINHTRKEGRGLYGGAPPIYWLHIIAAVHLQARL